MAPQELQALEAFLTQLTQARAGAKDPQAQQLIAEAVARQPDAAYLLVQRAMLLDHALATAQAQVVSLQGQLAAAQANGAGNGSFISAQNAWGNSAAAMPAAPAPVPPQAVPAQPARTGFLGGGFGSTLGSIATSASRRRRRRAPVPGHREPVPPQQRQRLPWPVGLGHGPERHDYRQQLFGNDDAAVSGNRNTAMSDGFLDDGGLSGGLDDSGFADDDSSLV